MERTIVIDPVTRIEGHGRVSIFLDENGDVCDARLHVTQFRGFEKLCEGRPYYEMPSLTQRICGICPIIHSIASAKACDQILGVRVPDPAVKLRRLINCAQIIQSHAVSFFHLSLPDLILGMDYDRTKRNLFGVVERYPSIARDGIRLRSIGQETIKALAGKRIHPAWVVPGGVNEPLDSEDIDQVMSPLPEAMTIVRRTLDWFKNSLEEHREEIRFFANFPSMFMGLVNDLGNLEFIDGKLRLIDYKGDIVADSVQPERYADYIGESVKPWSYLKAPYYKPLGPEEGMYRVGPAARLNIVDGCGTPLADQEWAEFRSLGRGPALSSFYNHYARLIEILYAVETMEMLLNDPDIRSPHVRAVAQPNYEEGIGVVEAPRGTLVHHYKVDEHGLVTWANLIVATGNNELAMNRGIMQTAKRFLNGKDISEGMLNRVEAVIRAFDPCLSCSTHQVGETITSIRLLGPDGEVLSEAGPS
ncbi:MAG: Ni/Fe hydrogenase subunit alpha [Desulfomonilaceae bacterium]|nr:Ni/Fe hydrogenase subunit alpha [Desulfomonilaceae bacterium]